MKIHVVISLALVLGLMSCQNRYANTDYRPGPLTDKYIAILPYEVITEGRMPKEITEEQISEIEDAESEAFQASLYFQILDRLDSRRYRNQNISLQAYHETNKKIEAAGYTIRESWNIPADELAEILEVDAVFSAQVHKTQYLTDFESYGIFLTQAVMQSFSTGFWWFLPDNRTSDVRVYANLIDTQDGQSLWATSRICPTDWNWQTRDVVEKVNYRISKRLPR